MVAHHLCKLCGEASDVFFCDDLAQLHVILIHPEAKDNYESHVKTIASTADFLLEDGDMYYSTSLALEPFTSDRTLLRRTHPVVYQRLSEMLALVARNFAACSRRIEACTKSLCLLQEFAEFRRRSGNLARLLAESQAYYTQLHEHFKAFGYEPNNYRISHESDETDISQALMDLLNSTTGMNVVLSLANNPCQAISLLDLIEKELSVTSEQIALAGAEVPGMDRLTSRSKQRVFRSALRRTSMKLAEASDQLPSTLFLSGVELVHRDAVRGGAFADIFEGTYNGVKVALKRLRIFLQNTTTEHTRISKLFCKEALMWKHLSHPNILPFFGVANSLFSRTNVLCLVFPWMNSGNLHDYISSEANGHLNDGEIRRLMKEIAHGMAYLHSEDIVHGDLRGANILIDDQGHARLADFGLAIFVDSATVTASSLQGGATAWMAPELLDPDAFNLSKSRATFVTDIYSYGCVGWELHTGHAPFHPMKATQISKKIIEGVRPLRASCTRSIADGIWDLLEMCWQHQPTLRPSIADVQSSLRKLDRLSPARHIRSRVLSGPLRGTGIAPKSTGPTTEYWRSTLRRTRSPPACARCRTPNLSSNHSNRM